jgi:hypothetical protein
MNEIRSPVTKGDNPLQDPKLEEFSFTLQPARGQEKLLATRPMKPGATSFRDTGETKDNETAHKGSETAHKESDLDHAWLNGKGQLVINANDGRGYGTLNADLIKGRQEVSFEIWFTPTATRYHWNPVVQFRGGQDAFYYTFRTLKKHRAELIVNGHNEDIQRTLDVKVGTPMHVVITYDQDGRDGKPLLCSYVNGKQNGQMVTSIKLSELALDSGKVGPFAGVFDELRIYDYPLTSVEVQGNFFRGPDRVEVKR